MKSNQGFTLLELSVAIGLLMVLTGLLLSTYLGMNRTMNAQQTQMNVDDDLQMIMFRLTSEVRQAFEDSIVISGDMNDVLEYQIPADLDGNGTPLDGEFIPEKSTVRSIHRDFTDLNNDGLTLQQVIMVIDDSATVLANHIPINEDTNQNGALDSGEDHNNNGRLERGLQFVQDEKFIRIYLDTSNDYIDTQGTAVSHSEILVTVRN